MIGYIQFAVNIVISRHHHRLLCPKKWTKTPLISVRSKITQTIKLILYQIALTTIFDDNLQLWSKSSFVIFWVDRFRKIRQAFSTLSILNKDTFLLTLCRIRSFVTARKISPKSPPQNHCFYEVLQSQFLTSDFFSFFRAQIYSFFPYKQIRVKYVIFL